MFIFFEIPILFIVFLVLGILGIDLGPIMIIAGVIGFFCGLPFVLSADEDQKVAWACLFLLPNVLIIILGICIGDHSLFDLLF